MQGRWNLSTSGLKVHFFFLAHAKLPEFFISHRFLVVVEGMVTEIQTWWTVNESMSVRREKKNSQQLQAESWGLRPVGIRQNSTRHGFCAESIYSNREKMFSSKEIRLTFLCFEKGFLMDCWVSWALWHAWLATGKTCLCLDTRDIRVCSSLHTRASESFTERKRAFKEQ